MKWKQDLVKDIRTFSAYDDADWPPNSEKCTLEAYNAVNRITTSPSYKEVTTCNYLTAEQQIRSLKQCRAILEIGISRNGEGSITQAFLKNKPDSAIYVGIDIDDKSYLNNVEKNIYTIQNSSSDYEGNLKKIREFGVDQFDLIFIDGWHSVNQVLLDWEYTNLLSDDGIVGLHDINWHFGPKDFIAAVNTNLWNVERFCPDDWGVGFLSKKK
jgi:hypothetical protein